MNIDFEELHVFDNSLSKYVPREMFEKAQAESDRRLGMLRRLNDKMHICLICHGHLLWIGDKEPPRIGHADGCELAEELKGNG